MCPDRHFISLYFDGELPSPWNEKMEIHLKSCDECRAILEGYSQLGERLKEEPEKALQAAQARVWEKLSVRRTRTRTSMWNRYITLPLPAAAAAVLIIVVFFALVGIRGLTRPSIQDQVMAAGIGLDDYGMIHIQDMAGVLQYLSVQDNGDFMVIPLPEIRKFSHIGEPALINAADYSRRKTFR